MIASGENLFGQQNFLRPPLGGSPRGLGVLPAVLAAGKLGLTARLLLLPPEQFLTSPEISKVTANPEKVGVRIHEASPEVGETPFPSEFPAEAAAAFG